MTVRELAGLIVKPAAALQVEGTRLHALVGWVSEEHPHLAMEERGREGGGGE